VGRTVEVYCTCIAATSIESSLARYIRSTQIFFIVHALFIVPSLT
jgi:hypothetical protein